MTDPKTSGGTTRPAPLVSETEPLTPRTAPADATPTTVRSGGPPRAHGAPDRIGRYVVRCILGEGAFGRVYRGSDPELGREVAIKVPLDNGLSARAREEFLREARAAATIHHPNVCPVYDVGTDGELPYIIMRHVMGPTLSGFLDARNGPLPEREAAEIARKLALGVAAAHARGVVHRDLKPGNVLLDEAAGEVLVTDFGLARVAGESGRTAPGAVKGTPAYMAPEQARGEVDAVGPPADVYALGGILFRMLTGESLFRGTADEVMAQTLAAVPRSPTDVRPGLDPRLTDLCLRALAKDPADRPPSAAAFADVLGTYLGLPPVSRLRGNPAETLTVITPPRATGRRVTRRVVAAAVFTAGVVGGTALLRQGRVGRDEGVVSGHDTGPGAQVVQHDDERKAERPPVDKFATHQFDQAAERRAAEWVLSCGGVLGVVPAGETAGILVRDPGALPAAFRVDGFVFQNNPLVTDEAIRQNVAGLTGPLQVELFNCSLVTDTGVAVLAAVPGLARLLLHGQSGVTDLGVARLAGHPTLRELALEGTGVTEAALPHLETLRLTHLSLWGLPVTDEWLARVSRIRTLENLNLTRTRVPGRITPRGLSNLRPLDRLQVLTLADAAVDGDGLRELAHLPALETLVLQDTRIDDNDLSVLKGFSQLKAVRLQGTPVTDAGMAALASCPELVEVNVGATAIGDDGVRTLVTHRGLRRVFLDGTRVTDVGVRAVAGLPRLEQAGFLETGIADAGMEALSRCPELTLLNVGPGEITDAGVAHLGRLKRLQDLGLRCPKATDRSVDVLVGITSLRRLDLWGTPISLLGRARLRTALRKCAVVPYPPLDP